jgi:hypothetical protein
MSSNIESVHWADFLEFSWRGLRLEIASCVSGVACVCLRLRGLLLVRCLTLWLYGGLLGLRPRFSFSAFSWRVQAWLGFDDASLADLGMPTKTCQDLRSEGERHL